MTTPTRVYTLADVTAATGATSALAGWRHRHGHLPPPDYLVSPRERPGWSEATFRAIVDGWAPMAFGPKGPRGDGIVKDSGKAETGPKNA